MLFSLAPCLAAKVKMNVKVHDHSHVGGPRMPSAVKLSADYEYGTITVAVSGYSGPVIVSVYDEAGLLVETTSAALSGSGQIILNDADLPEGLYVLQVALGALAGVTSGNSAFTLGFYSFGPKNYVADWRDNLFVHEYGHYIQSQYLGLAYLPVIGAPSLASASGLTTHIDHERRWFEVSASKLGSKHFDDKYGRGAAGYVKGDKNYFSLDTFRHRGYSPYVNPRLGKNYQDKGLPTDGTIHSGWDIIIPSFLTLGGAYLIDNMISPTIGMPPGMPGYASLLFGLF